MDEKVCSALDLTSTDPTTLSVPSTGVFIKANGGPPSSHLGTECPSTSLGSTTSTLKRSHQHHHHHHHHHGNSSNADSRRSISWHRFASHLGVCALVLAYALLGSIVFLALEGHESIIPEVQPRAATSGGAILTNSRNNTNTVSTILSSSPTSANDWRQKTVESIWDITVSLNILYKENWTRLAGQELTRFQHQLHLRLERQAAAVASSSTLSTNANDNNAEWTLARAFLYSLTLLTTIGVPEGPWPRSVLGKAATVCYAALGIPLMLLYLSTVGAVLGSCAKGVFSKALCCCLCSNCGYCCYDEVRMAEKERRERLKRQGLSPPQPAPPSPPGVSTGSVLAPLLLCLTALTFYIALGAIILSALEPSRSFLDSAYICFLCVTTIGLPLGTGGAARPATLWFCSGYIVVGMALTATCCTIAHGQLLAARPHGHYNGSCVHRGSLRGLRGPDS